MAYTIERDVRHRFFCAACRSVGPWRTDRFDADMDGMNHLCRKVD
jgi:hypothetical protein